MNVPRHILIFRFSSMGDVAMTVPVIRLLLQQYPDVEVTIVTDEKFQPIFSGIKRLNFYPADLKDEHKGIPGLYRLLKAIKKSFAFDSVADLHHVLRTRVLRSFLLFSGKPVSIIDKGRASKKALTRKENKILVQLPSTFERYAEVFRKIGLPVDLNQSLSIIDSDIDDSFLPVSKEFVKYIGIAPFARHEEKIYPPEKMKAVIKLLLKEEKIKILLFGGGETETKLLQQWAEDMPGVINLSGKLNFEQELKYISRLDIMVSMDSANMHLAALYNIPVVSVWGATHPYAGFFGWGQEPDTAIQTNLYCRPCSVFGNKKCYRGDHACMHQIDPETIYLKVMETLTKL